MNKEIKDLSYNSKHDVYGIHTELIRTLQDGDNIKLYDKENDREIIGVIVLEDDVLGFKTLMDNKLDRSNKLEDTLFTLVWPIEIYNYGKWEITKL